MSHSTIRTALTFLVSALPVEAALAQGGGSNGETARVSLTSTGAQAFQSAASPSISRDGMRIAFETFASLVPSDTNGLLDVYVVDRAAGTVELVSRSAAGTLGNGASFGAALSGDGLWVAFTTHATNLYGFDNNGQTDVLRKSLVTGELKRASSVSGSLLTVSGQAGRSAISFDGRFVAFESTASAFDALDTNGVFDVYVHDFQNGQIKRASTNLASVSGNGASNAPAISDDGRFVAFHSGASNFVAGDVNARIDVFTRDMWGGLGVELVSRVPGGALGNDDSYEASISSSGRWVAFTTEATNFVAGDTNNSTDVFLFDRAVDVLRHVSRATNGGFALPGDSHQAKVSGDGKLVAFTSIAPDITTDGASQHSIYVRDVTRGQSWLVSRATGVESLPDGASIQASIDADGTTVAFRSAATNLVPGDGNLLSDVFVRTLYADPLTYCTSSITSGGCEPSMSSTGLPRATQNLGFVVSCDDVPNNKLGLFFYGFDGRQAVPFGAGTFCMLTPVQRTPVMNSGGNPGSVNDCSGSYSLDFNAYAKGLLGVAAPSELTTVGQRVNVQCWGRDPQGAIATTFLSNALEYVVGP